MCKVYSFKTGKEITDISELESYKEPNVWSFSKVKDSIIVRFGNKLPKFVIKAWENKSKEPYRFGCTHNIQWRLKKYKNWNKPMPFPMDLDPNSDILGREVINGGMDPLAWIDSKYKVSYNHILNRRGKQLAIHTRSDLVAREDYLKVLDKINHRIIIYITQVDETALRQLEPGAPSNSRRREAANRLAQLGYNVQIINQTIPNKISKGA